MGAVGEDFIGFVVFTFVLCLIQVTADGVSDTDPTEVSALRAVKKSLIDPHNHLISWDRRDPCRSKWLGITCHEKSGDDDYMHVKYIHLFNRNLSGTLAPELGQLLQLGILDFMWNNISGSIPKEIGNLSSLELLVVNGNKLSGSLPDELGNLSKMKRIQIDQNNISGSFPESFKNLINMKHMHMNNNSISGHIPPYICKLPKLIHFLLDNNNLSGQLPPEFSEADKIVIIQIDNNNFSGSSIPESYTKIKGLTKLSLRNCGLQGTIPDLSGLTDLQNIDLSENQLEGTIPSDRLSKNIISIDLSYNRLTGSIPSYFFHLPCIQFLSLKNNSLNGSITTSYESKNNLTLDLQNNKISNVSDGIINNPNVTIMLKGNPICSNENKVNLEFLCGFNDSERSGYMDEKCPKEACPTDALYEYARYSNGSCSCVAPLRVGYRLKCPSFWDFSSSVKKTLEHDLDVNLSLSGYVKIETFLWEEGPRLKMNLKFFPAVKKKFNESEVLRLRDILSGWKITNNNYFGPYELLNFTLEGPYKSYENLFLDSSEFLTVRAIVGIVFGTLAASLIACGLISFFIMKQHYNYKFLSYKRHSLINSRIKSDGLKEYTFKEIAQLTQCFSESNEIGKGGYGHVYKGILADGKYVAIKRADEGSLQGSKEFYNEIQLLSRLRHKNLVSLVGYCDEKSEQMLVYEFIQNGTLHDFLSETSKKCPDFPMRLRIALESAKGILYLHTEADPPVLHRDIKSANILLDFNFIPKVADFGLSRLAPSPDDEGNPNGHVSTAVKGTPGYLDPEYFLSHRLTDKSDVYSLGVVFLEIITGKRPISNGRNICREVRMAHRHGRAHSLVDSRMTILPSKCVEKFVVLALRCCDENMDSRPSMSEVVRELEHICHMDQDLDFSKSGFVTTESSSVSSISMDLTKSSESCSQKADYGSSLSISTLR